MYKLDYAEFYITNVCNLNCVNCNRFNNFNFTGHELWHEHVRDYELWARLIDIESIGILGGEPMLNPEFLDWVRGIATLWPNAKINIITNGTQFHRWPDLYELLEQFKGRVTVGISEHNFPNRDNTLNNIERFLKKPFTKTIVNPDPNHVYWQQSYGNIRDPSWPDCNSPNEFVNLPQVIRDECEQVFHVSLKIWQEEIYSLKFVDDNNVTVRYSPSNSFYNSTVIHDTATGQLRLNHSDPARAIAVCYSKKCHHFIQGQLYKCGPVGILPDFIQQFFVDISDADRDLINSYVPAKPTWTQQQLDPFISDLIAEVPIAQCTFCPEQLIPRKFNSTTKKIKLVKRQR